jgi:hypothetical protein
MDFKHFLSPLGDDINPKIDDKILDNIGLCFNFSNCNVGLYAIEREQASRGAYVQSTEVLIEEGFLHILEPFE